MSKKRKKKLAKKKKILKVKKKKVSRRSAGKKGSKLISKKKSAVLSESAILALIDKGRHRGFVTQAEVLNSFPEVEKDKASDWLNKLDKSMSTFQEFLNKYEVKRIKIGDKFDPILHEAVEVEDGGQNIQEVRAGYIMHDKVIRPARVKIIK